MIRIAASNSGELVSFLSWVPLDRRKVASFVFEDAHFGFKRAYLCDGLLLDSTDGKRLKRLLLLLESTTGGIGLPNSVDSRFLMVIFFVVAIATDNNDRLSL